MRANTTTTTCINPATGETIGESPLHSVEDLKTAVESARKAQAEWAAWPVKKRVKALKPVLRYLVNEADALSEMITKDNGKTRVDAMATEVLPAAVALKYYMKHSKKFLKPRSTGCGTWVLAHKRSKIHRVPFGVIGIISPWNYPFAIPFSEVVMALLSGNAVILKTASQTQMVGLALEKSIRAASLPEGLFSFINMSGRDAGKAFLENRIDKLFFTGSVNAGKWLMNKASETLTPVVLELGGNDAMLVCPDADLNRAASGAVWAGLSNAGQSCGGVERVYVHQDVYDGFLEILKKKVEALRVDNGMNFDADMAAMTTKSQIDAVNAHIDDAVKKGAAVFVQSNVPTDEKLENFIPATVLTGVNHDMDVMKEETFGPVMGVMKVSNMEEAVQLANDSDLGLTGSVWSRSRKNAKAIAKQVRAGAVTINDHLMSHGLPETPWGGFNQSSLGRSHGKIGFDEMTEPQVIVNDVLPFARRNMWWQPYSEKIYKGLKGLMEFLYSPKFGRRLSGMGRLLKILPGFFKRK